MKNSVIVLFTMFFCSNAAALDLHNALTIAYDNNDELQIIRKDFLDEIEQFPQALSRFLPNITASVDSSDGRRKSMGRFANNPSSSQKTLRNVITIEQPVFNGGGSVALLKAAQSSFHASRGRFYASEQQSLLGVIQTYLDFVEAQEKFSISEVSVLSNKKQLEAMQEKMAVGESTETEVASARAALAMAETNKLAAYAALQSTKAGFIRSVGIEPTDLTMPSVPENLPDTLEELLKKSLVLNPTLEYVRHSVNASKANEAFAKSALLPQASFRVEAGKNYFDPENGQNSEGGNNVKSVTSTLSLQIPIYSRGGVEYSRVRKAKNSTNKIVYQLEDQLKRNNLECVGNWENFTAAKSKIISTTSGVEAAEIAYNGTIEEEKVGSKSILDVLKAEEMLNRAKVAKIEAQKEYILAAYQIKRLMGQLTAKSLKLNVSKLFNPEQEFKKVKTKIIGF